MIAVRTRMPTEHVRSRLAAMAAVLMAALVCLGCPAAPRGWADEAGDLGTDRDAFTPNTHTVKPGTALWEGSYVFIDNQTGLPTNNYPELLLRVGGNEWFEWRFGVNYGVGSQGAVVTSVEVGEGTLSRGTLYESSVLYGFKVDTSDQQGWLPESCFIMEASTPTYGDVFGTVPVATGVWGWELAGGYRLDTSLRYAYTEGLFTWFSRWSPSVVLRIPFTDRWETHVEYFGNFTNGNVVDTSQEYFSPGTHYLLTKHFEVGLRVGWGMNASSAPFFSDAGFGWRW
jgi:hypothetical protein